MDGQDQNKIKKISVKSDDELTDIVRKIESAPEDRVVLTFSGPSDLLVSPVNLQVIQETADNAGKPLVFQIFDNTAGSRNAGEIGAVHTDDTEQITEDMWNMAYIDMQSRNKKFKDKLKGAAAVASAAAMGATVSKMVGDEEVDADQSEAELVDNTTPEQEAVPEKKSEFQERIDSALEKSKGMGSSKEEVVEEGGLKIAVDHDIKDDLAKGAAAGVVGAAAGAASSSSAAAGEAAKYTAPQNEPQNLTGRDFMSKTEKQPTIVDEEVIEEKVKDLPVQSKALSMGGSLIPKSVPSIFKNKKLILFIFIPLILIGILSAFLVYRYAPLVKIKMYIESRPVTAEKEFTGNPSVEEFDLENGSVPIKKEEVKKERSDSTNASGTATRGKKASGLVRFVCGPIGGETGVPKTIPAGTTVTTDDGLSFVTVADSSFTCPSTDFPTVTAEAADFGNEFNISSGVLMEVSGEPDVAATSETSFTGGSKEEYTVIAQADYDRIVNPLKETSFKEAEDELKSLATDGWEVVPGSIKSALDGDVVTDNPVGTEAEVLNATVKTVSTALYYRKDEIDDSVEDLLLQSAIENDLFESDDDLELSLASDYSHEITVVSIEGDNVTLKLVANGEVKPTVDKEEIVEDLKGLGWDEGLDYLDDLKFVAKDTEVSFEPDWFPESLRYFPSRQGRILITVEEVEVDLPTEEAPSE